MNAIPSQRRGRCGRRASAEAQRGLATLLVVAVLFFVLSMVAAYTNRNLIFEQRTATNQLRSTQAFEAAEAGVEWTLAMLNTGLITAATCMPSDDSALDSFRQRYLDIDASSGMVTAGPNMGEAGGARAWPTCVQNGTDWTCVCPTTTSATPTAPTGSGVAPAFRVRLMQQAVGATARPGTVWVQVNGCTRLEAGCLDFPPEFEVATVSAGEGRVRVEALIALKPALASLPMAAVTVREDLQVDGTLTAANPTRGGSGIAVIAGGGIGPDVNLSLSGPAGTPLDMDTLRMAADAALSPTVVPDGDRFFQGVYGAIAADYSDQPAALHITCTAGCDADRLRAVVARNPGRIVWAEGDVALNGGASLGTATAPVALVVTGNLSLSNITVFGLVHGRAAAWAVSGSGGVVNGALVAENDLTITSGATLTVVRDAAVLDRVRAQHGSFVRVPGGWKDF